MVAPRVCVGYQTQNAHVAHQGCVLKLWQGRRVVYRLPPGNGASPVCFSGWRHTAPASCVWRGCVQTTGVRRTCAPFAPTATVPLDCCGRRVSTRTRRVSIAGWGEPSGSQRWFCYGKRWCSNMSAPVVRNRRGSETRLRRLLQHRTGDPIIYVGEQEQWRMCRVVVSIVRNAGVSIARRVNYKTTAGASRVCCVCSALSWV